MNLFQGISYNIKGLRLALKTPRLLMLGLVRFGVIVLMTISSIGAVLYFHEDIMNLIWAKPAGGWLQWIWHITSWMVSLLLTGITTVLAYLISQILFSVVIMDYMSRITEKISAGHETTPESIPLMKQFVFLVKQELPRTTLPILAALLLMVLGWMTPLGPILTVASTGIAIIFLAWDNTDLVPARRMQPFSKRFRFLMKTLPFHLGFGLPFLIPLVNILFLSFAPVGATLYYTEHVDA